MILYAGSDTRALDNQGQTALHTFVLSRFSCNTGECAVRIATLLIQAGVPVETPDAEGRTALDILRGKKSTFRRYRLLLKTVADFRSRSETVQDGHV